MTADTFEIILKIVEIIFIIIAGIGLFNYSTAYKSQRGVNAAMKEDVEEIEKIIKSVEQEFQRQDKVLAAKLNQISGFKEQQRQAIIDYHDKVQKTKIMIDNPDISSAQQATQANHLIITYYAEQSAAYDKMRLMNVDSRLSRSALNLDSVTHERMKAMTEFIHVVIDYRLIMEHKVADEVLIAEAWRDKIAAAKLNYDKAREVKKDKIKNLIESDREALEEFQNEARRVIAELSNF